ncbi:cytochrome P450, partial [Dendrothele bispora CBS 962.96]
MPTKKPWHDYQEMGKVYGDVLYFKSLRDHIVVLNSAKAANDILEKQARVSSDRPHANPLDEYVQWDTNTAFAPYSEDWRRARRTFHQNFRSEAVTKWHPLQTEKVHKFLTELYSSPSPQETVDSISALSQAIIIKSIYGWDIKSNDEDLPQAAKDVVDRAGLSLLPGAFAFKSIPFIQYVPNALPFLKYSRWLFETKDRVEDLRTGPFNDAMDAWNAEGSPSLIADLKAQGAGDDLIKNIGWTALVAAADTTMSAIATFFLAVSLNPQVQVKAQALLDRVLGRGVLPKYSDRTSLPYIEAIYRETMRWHPTVPFGVPHKLMEDIIYRGWFIPKGTIVHANIWAITHDPAVYPNPNEFIPERHYKEDGNYDSIHEITGYGFGRRVCVGRYFADATLWLTIASVLATMNVTNTDLQKNDANSKVKFEEVEECYADGGL